MPTEPPTLRDWFAVQALQAVASEPDFMEAPFPHALVAECYRIADEMLRQRKYRPAQNGCSECDDDVTFGWVVPSGL